MNDIILSLHKQLAEAEENLRLIQERKAEYVQGVDIPLQLVRDERRLEAQIPELRARLEQLAQAQLDADMDRLRTKRDQADQERREMRDRQRVVNLRPLDVTHIFKDRLREIRALCDYLADDSVRLISVVGRGGMGKTALACRVLADLERGVLPVLDEEGEERELPIDGILYLSARSTGLGLERIFTDVGRMLGEPDADRLAARWANEDTPLTAKVEYLLEAMRDGAYFILLDNVEDYLTEDGEIAQEGLRLFIDRCLTQAGGVRLIATSREEIGLAAAALRGVRNIPLREGLSQDDAVVLLRDLDPQGTLGLRDAPDGALRRATRLTRGIPRALEILAGILHRDPTASLHQLFADESLFGERVVERLVAEGYHRLEEDERRVMEGMAVLDRPVTGTTVAYLLHPWFPGLDVRACLRCLVRGYFVGANRLTGEYSLAPPDRDYAYNQIPAPLDDNGRPDAYSRHNLELRAADFYVGLRKPRSEWESIDDLEPQLAEFEHRVRAGDYDGACRVLNLIDSGYLYLWGHYARLVELRVKLLGRLTDTALEATNLGSLAHAHRALGHFERAIRLYEQAIATAREIGDLRYESICLGHLGRVHRRLGQLERAVQFYRQALAIARRTGDRRNEVVCLGRLGIVYRRLGKVEQAKKLCEDGLTIARDIGYRREEGIRLGDLGSIYRDLGQSEQAIDFHEQALAIAREIGHRRYESIWLTSLGLDYRALGQVERALVFIEEALAISREISDRLREGYQLLELGRSRLAAARLSTAQGRCTEALALDIPEINCQATLVLGIVLLHQRDPAAGETFADAVARCRVILGQSSGFYKARYTLAIALVGSAVCDSRWEEVSERAGLLAPALTEYRRALENCSAPGVVRDALWNLEMIRAAGSEGLEPAFELLESTV